MKPTILNSKFLAVLIIFLTFALANCAMAFVDLEALSIENSNRPPDGICHPDQEYFQVGYRVFNGGDETSDDYTIEVYIGDYLVGTKTNGGLDPQRDRGGLILFPFPTDISLGTHTLRMKILCPNDDTPNNNEVSGEEVTIAEKGPPDLWFSYFYVPGNLFYGTDSVTLNCRVENIGHSDSDSYTLDFYIDGYNLGSETRNSIAGHGSDGFSCTITLPYDFPEGTYTITAELTCSDDSDPGNNSAQRTLTVGKSVLTSMSIESVDAAGDVYQSGESIVVRIEVNGIGGHLDTSFDIDVYASADRMITTSDYKIHSYESETISPGEFQFLCEDCKLPADIPTGYYYLGIILTYESEDGTESETTCDYGAVYIGGYDVIVQSVGITPGGYMPGEDFIVYSLTKNSCEWDTGGYAVDYYASTDAVVTEDDYHIGYVERDGLAPGEQHSYETTFQVPFNLAPGNYYIGAIVTCPRESDMANNTGCSEETIELVHPANYVCGQMRYKSREWLREYPIRYALVDVYDAGDDQDPLDDAVIGRTYTDQNGNYGVAVFNDEAGGQNIYVKVFAESAFGAHPESTGKSCSVRDDVFDEIYYSKSDLYAHPRDLSVIISMTTSDEGGEFMIYDSVIEGFYKARMFLDVNMPEMKVFWPSEYEATYFDPSNRGMYVCRDDRGDRDVILHEYGHFIADVYAFGQGSVGENGAHYWNVDLRDIPTRRNEEEARNLTFREAWATLFSIAVQYGDTWYSLNSGDTKYQDLDEESGRTLTIDLEKDTDDLCRPGEYYEHMNCCALWDIFDDADDNVDNHDTLSDINLTKIWTIVRDSQPDDIIDFWNGWFQRYDYETEITRIFEDHGMSFENPGN